MSSFWRAGRGCESPRRRYLLERSAHVQSSHAIHSATNAPVVLAALPAMGENQSAPNVRLKLRNNSLRDKNMKQPRRLAGTVILLNLVTWTGAVGPLTHEISVAQVVPHGQDAIPNPPRTADAAVRAMTVPAGFEVEIVAQEPDIVNPVAMTFDERGRIWITESLEYPRRSPGPGRDRVKVIEDTDGDGRADRFSVFAEGLNIPSGVAVGHGGVWVANSPDILFLRDRDGDGKADSKEVVATGFGRDDTHELPNSLTWGPDGWLYGWNGVFNRSEVVSKNGRTYKFTCAIFRIHPRTRQFEIWCEGTSNPWGIAIDTEGSFFASACVIDHLWHLVETGYYIRQGGPYPPFTWPIESIVDHKHQKAAYCGIHYFDSPAYPPEYRGRLYMGNIHGNCINVDLLERDGSTYRARSAPDFLQANDAWFMPVSQKTGPDGCLYILDWYDRYHCYQDANRDPAGIDRLKGRLYRVRYKDSPRRTGFDLARSTDDELVKLLGSANVYDRDIAQRLLGERASPSIRAKLQSLVLDGAAARTARMHGLWSLLASGPLDPAFHAKLLGHSDATFRAWGVRAAGNMTKVDEGIRNQLVLLVRDPSPDVRLQLAVAARKLEQVDSLRLLLGVERSSYEDSLVPHIVWQNLNPLLETHQGELVRRFEEDNGQDPSFAPLAPRAIDKLFASAKPDPHVIASILNECLWSAYCREAVDVLAARFRAEDMPAQFETDLRREIIKVVEASNLVLHFPNSDERSILLAYCADATGLQETRKIAFRTWKNDDPGFRRRREEIRIRAIEALLFREDEDSTRRLLEKILAETESASSAEFRGDVLDLMSRLDDAALAPMVIRSLPSLPAELKPRAVELLTERPIWTKALLAAIEAKQVPASTVNLNQLRRLGKSRDPETARRLKAIWGTIRDARNPRRERLVDEMRQLVRKRLGDAFKGQAVFSRLCAQCHVIYGQGQDVGPDITASGRNEFDQLLSNVFDPSLVIGPGYQATTVATTDGRVLTGLLAEDGRERVILKIQGGKRETIPRAQIDEIKTSPVSLMPEDVEKQLSPEEIADLFAFLCLDKPPSDRTARSLPGSGPIAPR
jgi:putative membrane-bound dehydrogenase-like protein